MKLQRDIDGFYRIPGPDAQLEAMLDRQFKRSAPGKLEWKDPSWRGLGDVIKSATDALGIKQCGGCAARQEMFNKILPNPFAKEQTP